MARFRYDRVDIASRASDRRLHRKGMSRPLRLEFPGALYHITSRGDGRDPIYLDDRDRITFLSLLAQVCERYCWGCYSYCLMTNHYHLLIETGAATLARGMRQLNGVYTQQFNRAHQRVGHVYQGRYTAILVQKEQHLRELVRYIVLNPVRAGMVPTADQWRWSSYEVTHGPAPSPPWLLTDRVTALFGTGEEGRHGFAQFVEDGGRTPSAASSCWQHLRHQIYLGDSTFVARAQARIASDAPGLSEVPVTQRRAPARPPQFPLRHARTATSRPLTPGELAERSRAIVEAYTAGGLTMRAIGERLGIHYSRVSRIISAAERAWGKT